MRDIRSLNGDWQFQLDPAGILNCDTLKFEQHISVPMPWQAAFPELAQYSGYAWYGYTLDLATDLLMQSGELLLCFGAVDYWCQVFVNGQLVGQHEGGYTPFSFPVKSLLRASSNSLLVRVYDAVQTEITIPRWPNFPTHTPNAGPPFDAVQLLHGKQEWYVNVGGIWQDVELRAVPATYLSNVEVKSDIHKATALFEIELDGAYTQFTGELQVVLSEGAGQNSVRCVAGQSGYSITVAVKQPHLWKPADPHLYTATLVLLDDSNIAENKSLTDTLEIRFGLREISTLNGQFMLNDEPLFLLAALDQDIYADTIYTVPSDEYLRDQFAKAKALGLNCLRCHIKPPDPHYLDLADEMGLLVWEEIPSWRTFYNKGTLHAHQLHLDELIKEQVAQTLAEMVRRDFNHPSLIIWTLVNEDWGTALALSADDRAWVSDLYHYCKQLDPTRLVVDNSACLAPLAPNVHVHSDLDDFHIYAGIPEQADNFEQFGEQFNLHPAWTYSSHADIERTYHEPLVLSEFGNWGLPSLRLLHQHYGGDPDWFELGPWWARSEGEPGWPKQVAERFYKFGLQSTWEDYEEWATATQWHQFAALKFEIEVLRRQPQLAGYVITELADIYWESNGLLDFLRNPKAYHQVFAAINAPDVVIPQLDSYSAWDDQTLTVQLHLSHYGPDTWAELYLDCGFVNSNPMRYKLTGQERGSVRNMGKLSQQLPRVSQAQMRRLEFRILNGTATEATASVAYNDLDLLILPTQARQPLYSGQLAVIGREPAGVTSPLVALTAPAVGDVVESAENLMPSLEQLSHEAGSNITPPSFEQTLRQLGYDTVSQLNNQTRLAISNYPNAALLEWVANGGDLLYLGRGPNPFYWVSSHNSSAGWISAFSWLKPGVHRRLEHLPNPLGMPFKHILTPTNIQGLPFDDPAIQKDFLAETIVGWINHPTVNTLQFRYGKGRVIMTTFTLERALPSDPVAVAMLHDLLEYLQSEACQPTLRARA